MIVWKLGELEFSEPTISIIETQIAIEVGGRIRN